MEAANLFNKELGITGDNVLDCEDIELLQYWEEKLTEQLRDVKTTLDQFDDLKGLNPELVEDRNYRRAYEARKFRLKFLDLILVRKKALKSVENKDQLLTRKFMSVAKDWLEPRMYKAILEEAKKRANYPTSTGE